MSTNEITNQDGSYAVLAYFSNAAEAGMVCELLINNGIRAVLQGEHFGALDPLPLRGGFSEIKLLVLESDLDRAQELHKAFFEAETVHLEDHEDLDHE